MLGIEVMVNPGVVLIAILLISVSVGQIEAVLLTDEPDKRGI